MPPMKNTPPAKAVKTERTHEENQERAYIAASRRSDRSLEARVESARRASEIHKRRTGRSLRVTEQDVINEEMYEEEDDDLPLQYRRLTEHLQTGSADFNRRLAAYLTNQVAMRTAMEQMVQSPYGLHPNRAYQGNSGMFPSPMLPQQQGMVQSPNAYQRPAPYPSPHHPSFRQTHGRAFSMQAMPTAQGMTSPSASAQQLSADNRRLSTPTSAHPDLSSGPQIQTDGLKADPEYQRQTQSATLPQGGSGSNGFMPFWRDMGPFTTSLPPESQQMLAQAPGFDVRDPDYAMLMQGSEQFINDPYYPWQNMHSGIKGMPVHPSAYPGMSATLAPAALEKNTDYLKQPVSTSAGGPTSAPAAPTDVLPSAGLDFKFSQESKEPAFTSIVGDMAISPGQVTPVGEGFWDHFVMDGSWEDGVNSIHRPGADGNPGDDNNPSDNMPGNNLRGVEVGSGGEVDRKHGA
ncbi:hypothetical protein A1O7_03743 [Cladophialophora yegresii CBS 114405]|uniref:Uncharacterized protein n=1 Tax=Cladophialophora yegresii CBS 114405 TaxID=1182544 RepID=W9VV23_9EURO|nr:uncharacterized protein A1O7_03743 [Cladophialophora yegresii CBS 114405]EXJ59597.1 hypothetical protein A1O7_03743 [Cladophialophora yegresii CBS 114405]